MAAATPKAISKTRAKAKARPKAKAKAKPKASAKTRKATSKAKADAVAKDAPAVSMDDLREFKALFPDASFAEAREFFGA